MPQVELVTGIKFLRSSRKEEREKKKKTCCVYPEVLYFFVKRAKSIQKHLDRYRKNKVRVFRLIFVEDRIHRFEWYYRCVKFLPASWKYIFCYGLGWYLWPILKTMRSKRFCAEDRTFLSEGERGGVPFRESLQCGIRSF